MTHLPLRRRRPAVSDPQGGHVGIMFPVPAMAEAGFADFGSASREIAGSSPGCAAARLHPGDAKRPMRRHLAAREERSVSREEQPPRLQLRGSGTKRIVPGKGCGSAWRGVPGTMPRATRFS